MESLTEKLIFNFYSCCNENLIALGTTLDFISDEINSEQDIKIKKIGLCNYQLILWVEI